MKLPVVLLAVACCSSSATKFSLLRIGKASSEHRALEYRNSSKDKSSLFEEDFDAAFRELFANNDGQSSFSMSFGVNQPRIKPSGAVDDSTFSTSGIASTTTAVQADLPAPKDVAKPEQFVDNSMNYQNALDGPPREQILPGKLDTDAPLQAGHVVAFSILGAVVLAFLALVVMKRMQNNVKPMESIS